MEESMVEKTWVLSIFPLTHFLNPVNTVDTDKTRLSSIVLSAVCTELEIGQNSFEIRQQKISNRTFRT